MPGATSSTQLARGFELETSSMEVPSPNHWATPKGRVVGSLSYFLMSRETRSRYPCGAYRAKPIHGADAVLKAFNIDGDVRIQYRDQLDFEAIARQFGIFEEWKDGVPRAAYKGIVVFRFQTSRRVFLVAPDSLRQLGVEDT
uniref:Alpha-1,3-mannosyl-glycoprotein 2-beta-N-acetylglucosaminyltransferase n=1 Tax=Solanum tuberosum TaxID=4113 RepID=M1B6A5_SOLTU